MSIIRYFAPDYVFEPHPTIEALHDPAQPIGVVVMFWVGALVLAPVLEELFFRGLIQTYLGGILRSRWAAIGIASVAFGFVHSFQPQAVLALILLAFLMGYAYERSGSLVVPIAIHAMFNLKTLIWDTLGTA